MKKRLDLLFPQKLVTKPIIHALSRKFGDVVFNIRQARVTEDAGEMILELSGKSVFVEKAVKWLAARGVAVKALGHDVVE